MHVSPIPIAIDGSANSKVVCSLGNANISTGYTLAALVRPTTVNAYHSLLQVVTSTPTDCISLESKDNAALITSVDAVEVATGVAVNLTATVWWLCLVTKASGSATPRFHGYSFNTSTWQHANAGAAAADTARTAANIQIGEWENADPFVGFGAAWAIWGDTLTDLQIETMTANFNAWTALSPQWMVVAHGTTPMVDEIGTGNETSRESGVTDGSAQTSPITWAATSVVTGRGGWTKFPKKVMVGRP